MTVPNWHISRFTPEPMIGTGAATLRDDASPTARTDGLRTMPPATGGSPMADLPDTRSNGSGTELDVVVIGSGFAGLYALHKLRNELGLNVRAFDNAGGVG